MVITIDLPDSQTKILIYPWCNKVHFVLPFYPPITMSIKDAERICKEVAAEKRASVNP